MILRFVFRIQEVWLYRYTVRYGAYLLAVFEAIEGKLYIQLDLNLCFMVSKTSLYK